MKKVELKECQRLSEVAWIITSYESEIDKSANLYLMTWSPDPKELPDCDFYNQHIYCHPYIQAYLQGCKAGLACVEATQLGNPHYHLWYQTYKDEREQARIRWIKVMSRIGIVKIVKGKHFKVDKWYQKGNCLHYYKKDAVGPQLFTLYNPIGSSTPTPPIDYTDYTMFFAKGKQTAQKIIEKVSQVKQLEEFYKKSL